MAGFSQAILLGNVTRDVEMKQLPSGTNVSEFGLAVNRRWNSNGEKREEVSFFDCEAFGKVAEVLANYVKKGDLIHVVGRLQQQRWEAQDGSKRSRVKIIVESLQMLGGKRGEDGGGQPSQTDEQQPF